MKSSRYPHLTTIELKNLLKRRKISLEDWVRQNGIFTYELLLQRCTRMGVVPPSEEEFKSTLPPVETSSPTEGIVVLPAPSVISASTGELIPEEELISTILVPDENEVTPHEPKKRRR